MARVAFLYNAQSHHILHSLPIACELSRLHHEHDVTVLARDTAVATIGRYAALYPGERISIKILARPWLLGRGKTQYLRRNRRLLDSFDAIVVPERTSIRLRGLGIARPRLIHCFHGSSGHDRVDDPRLAQFDLLLAPSPARLARVASAGNIRPGHAAVIGYAKLDLVERLAATRPPLFANDRPTVLYNPHHWADKSSWPVMGAAVLGWFAAQDRFNLVFAPHIRLFDPAKRHLSAFARWSGLPNIRVDLGSEASIDMSYAMASDIYLGDVSSQVFEFIIRPRPCIFLDPRGLDRAGDPDFRSWRLGRVVGDITGMAHALTTTADWQPNFVTLQERAAAEAFPPALPSAPIRGSAAIAAFLRDGMLAESWQQLPKGLRASGAQSMTESAAGSMRRTRR